MEELSTHEQIMDTQEPGLELSQTEIISIDILCRLCANHNERVIGIYSEEGISNDLANKMNLYLPIKVSEHDSLPLHCCWSCASTVLAWHELVVASVEADRRLRGLVEKGVNDIYESPISLSRFKQPENNDAALKKDEESAYLFDENSASTDSEEDLCYQCKECQTKFATEKFLAIHKCKKQVRPTKPICEICKTTFARRCDMLRHIKRQHIEKAPTAGKRRRRVDINYKIFCDICETGFVRQNDMIKHRANKHPDLVDAKPEMKSQFASNLAVHLKAKHDKIRKRFRRKREEIVASFYCDICNKGFTRRYDMLKHRKLKHPDEPEPEQSFKEKANALLEKCRVPSSDSKTYYQCETCGRLFKQSYNFMRHQSIHTGVRAFYCHICGKSFRVSSGLHRHITEHHYGVKKYPCDICGRSFAAKTTRDDHKNIHTNHRPFVCDVCGKAFRQKASLHIHKLFHGDNFRFTCNICGKKFRRASELKVHGWMHSGHKPHHCSVCGSMFRLRQDLKRHLKIHDKLNECICTECGSTFSQERYLRNHKKTHKMGT